MRVDGCDLDLAGLQILPGLINAHDHLQFSLFPRLGNGPYANAGEWARDIYHPDKDPVMRHLKVPKGLRLIWGGLRNLVSGVTTVSHHDAYDPVFDADFPVRVVKQYGWAHSLEFGKDIRASYDATPEGAPFLIHLGEGTDRCAGEEIFRLNELGALGPKTVLVHAVGLTPGGWELVRKAGASVIWCPRSNLFTLGRTLQPEPGVPLALGTDSSITTEGDLLDELAHIAAFAAREALVTTAAARVLRLRLSPSDWIATPRFGAPPKLVVIGSRIRLIAPDLAEQMPPETQGQFRRLAIGDRPPAMVPWNVPQLIGDTLRYLDGAPLLLAGRAVS
jgi:cytosine/adenosine deaminase-related metal-dependent hydrolase